MESLAAAAAIVMLSIVGSSLLALVAGIWRLRILGWVAIPLSVAAGAWFIATLPHAWPFGAWCVGVGVWAAFRLAWQRTA